MQVDGSTAAGSGSEATQSFIDSVRRTGSDDGADQSAVVLNTHGYALVSMSDLMQRQHKRQTWVVANLLASGGMSILAGKPKQGKSTLARNLALAVARGNDFLGCKTQQGPVLYLALEEIELHVQHHFKQMGGAGSDPIHTAFAEHRIDDERKLEHAISEHKPALVIIDPLFHFVRIKDGNSYAEVNDKMKAISRIARRTGTHILFIHHMKKGFSGGDDSEQILGSQAFHGIVDAQISFKKLQGQRFISVSQRYAEEWPETFLDYDDQTRTFSIGQPRHQIEREDKRQRIIEFVISSGGKANRTEILDGIEGKTQEITNTISDLVGEGKLSMTGSGKKGDPNVYHVVKPSDASVLGSNEDQDAEF